MTDWSGTVGVGIASSNVEYFDEPALAVMLCALPPDQYRVFSGVAPLASTFTPHTALVHADAGTPDVAELIAEMADRTATGYLFGGLASSRGDVVQFAVGGNGNLKVTARRAACSAACRAWLRRRRAAGVARDPGLPADRAGAHHHEAPTATW